MSATTVKLLLEQSSFYVSANTTGLEAGDDVVEVPNGGNSMNWILGHLAYWRNEMIELVGGTRVWGGADGRQYRGNPGERRPKSFEVATAIDFQELEKVFATAGRRVAAALDSEGLDSETLVKLQSLIGHEIYHAGQLGVLRLLAGRPGAL